MEVNPEEKNVIVPVHQHGRHDVTCKPLIIIIKKKQGSRDDAVMRALTSHKCGQGLIPGLGTIWKGKKEHKLTKDLGNLIGNKFIEVKSQA